MGFTTWWAHYLNSVSAAGPVQTSLSMLLLELSGYDVNSVRRQCHRRRRPRQARRRQGRLQITVMVGRPLGTVTVGGRTEPVVLRVPRT